MKHTTADIALVVRDYDEAMWAIASGNKRLNCDHHAMWRTPLIILLTFALLAAPLAVETQSPGDPPWRISLVPWGPTAGQPRPWRHDVRLLDRSAPGHPDDFQVLFANPDSARGGRHEIMWVRVIATDPSTDLFLGILLNEPRFLSSLAGGDNVVFRVPDGNDLPLAIADPTYGEAGWPRNAPTAFDRSLRDGLRAYRMGNDGHNMPSMEQCIAVLRPVMREIPPTVPTHERFVGHYILGRCAAEKYDTRLGIDQFRAAIALNPDDADAHLALLAELSVMTHHRPGEFTPNEEDRWERAFLDQLTVVRTRFADHPFVRDVLAMIFDPALEETVDSLWKPHIAKLRRIGYAAFRWKQR